MTTNTPSNNELREKLKTILEGVWHSRSVDDVIPELEALIASEVDKAVREAKRQWTRPALEASLKARKLKSKEINAKRDKWANKQLKDGV